MNLTEVINEIKKKEKSIYRISKDSETYTKKQILSIYRDLKENSKLLKSFKIEYRQALSRRRSLIVILEEEFYNEKMYPKNLSLDTFENKAKTRFRFRHASKNHFNTPQKTHPKKPCNFYEEKEKEKRHYREALKLLLETPELFFENKKAIKTLHIIYNEVKHCSNKFFP